MLPSLLPNPLHKTRASPADNDSVSRNSSSPSSSSSSSSSFPDMWSYLWIPFIISLSKEFVVARASDIQLQSSKTLHLLSDLNEKSSECSSVPKCPSQNPALNYRPIIGILSHPGDGASGRLNNETGISYIAASYVKFVESAGARVIPLIYNEPHEILFEKLSLVNGVLFTGGREKNGSYFDTVKNIFLKSLSTNDNGVHFPLYAICLGFELLSMIISKDDKILESFNAADHGSTLQFTENINIEGTVFQRFPSELLRKLETDCLAMQSHRYGISPERFQNNSYLSKFFDVITTSVDDDNKEYVSTIQARNYPITAFSWHPEKNAFEWGLPMIPHSEDAIQVTQLVANFFISEARKSSNRPPVQRVLDNLIYNYSPTYCGRAGKGYDEVYIFERHKPVMISKV